MTHDERLEAVAEVLEFESDCRSNHESVLESSRKLRAIAAEMKQPTSVLCTKCGYSASVPSRLEELAREVARLHELCSKNPQISEFTGRQLNALDALAAWIKERG